MLHYAYNAKNRDAFLFFFLADLVIQFFDKKKLDIRIYFTAAPCIPGRIPNDLILKRGQKRFNCVDLVKNRTKYHEFLVLAPKKIVFNDPFNFWVVFLRKAKTPPYILQQGQSK